MFRKVSFSAEDAEDESNERSPATAGRILYIRLSPYCGPATAGALCWAIKKRPSRGLSSM